MDEIRATFDLRSPSDISPDSTADFILQYENLNHNLVHRLQKIIISPTWDLSQEQAHELNHSVPTRTKQQVLTTPFKIPIGLGGYHGIYITFEVEVKTKDGDIQSIKKRTVEPLTVPVTGARQFRALIFSAGDGKLLEPVRRVVQQWGFDLYVAESVQSVNTRFTEFDDSPILFVGVVPTSGNNEHGRQQVSNAAWAAGENATLSIILTEQGISLPELPQETAVFPCQLADQRELLRATGPELLVERRALETEQPSRLNEVLRKGVSVTKRETKAILQALAYATLLTAVGATPQAVLDSIKVPDELWTGNDPESTRAANSWPMFKGNIANTGYQPQQPAPSSGVTTQWSVEISGSQPAVAYGTVYVGSDGTVYALDAATGNERWSIETPGYVRGAPAVVDGTVYVASDEIVYALDAATGNGRWSVEIFGCVASSPAVAYGTVYVRGRHGNRMYALDAATGNERWNARVGGVAGRSPAVADNTVYLRSSYGICAVDAVTGDERWSVEGLDSGRSSPAVMDGTVYFGRDDNTVYALDAATGNERWSVETSGYVRSSPAVADGTVYVGNDDNTMYALDAATGNERWSVETSGYVRYSPAVADGTVYFGSDGTVYALDAATGNERWNAKIYDYSPAVADGTVYVGGLYALTEP